MNQKRILAYVHAYKGHGRDAGAETTLANLLESLVRSGWQANVILSTPGVTQYTLNGVHCVSESSGGSLIEAVTNVRPEHSLQSATTTPDVLISHLECSERVALLGKKYNLPVIQLIHNTMWQTEGYLNEGCDLAVFNTEWVKAFHEEHKTDAVGVAYPYDEGVRIDFKQRRPRRWRSAVLHPQIDPWDYVSPDPRERSQFITLVNLFESKGAKMFFEMARRFPKRAFLAVEGGYGEQWTPDVIPGNVQIMKNTPDMAEVYALSKLMLMPSKYESFGRVAVEAAASGVPTVASDTPGLREALGSQQWLCPWDDADIWEQKIKKILQPEEYKMASFQAECISRYWDRKRWPETKAFISEVERLSTAKKWGVRV